MSELISEKNKPRRHTPFLGTGLIRLDYEAERCPAEQGLSLGDVPDTDRHIFVRKLANASAGGDVVDVIDELPQAIKDAAVLALGRFPVR